VVHKKGKAYLTESYCYKWLTKEERRITPRVESLPRDDETVSTPPTAARTEESYLEPGPEAQPDENREQKFRTGSPEANALWEQVKSELLPGRNKQQ
jgi:hypothetical protein